MAGIADIADAKRTASDGFNISEKWKLLTAGIPSEGQVSLSYDFCEKFPEVMEEFSGVKVLAQSYTGGGGYQLLTTKKERLIRMPYAEKQVSKTAKILFPIIITMVAGLFVPRSVALVGFLMFGNLIRECGVLDSLSETAQKVLANLITLLLGLTVASKMQAEYFLNRQTLMILALGLVAFVFDTIGGVLVAKVYNLFAKQKINPMIGAAGISAFPMSARVVNKMGLQEDNQNFLLMHAVGVNVSGQIASVIAGGMILTLFA